MPSGPAVSKSVCILVYGSDKQLLETRSMVLEAAGLRVFSATEPQNAEMIIETQNIALVVLCHSLSPQECDAALQFANSLTPIVKTIVLTAGASPCSERIPTEILSTFDGPGRLVQTIRNLLGEVPSPRR